LEELPQLLLPAIISGGRDLFSSEDFSEVAGVCVADIERNVNDTFIRLP